MVLDVSLLWCCYSTLQKLPFLPLGLMRVHIQEMSPSSRCSFLCWCHSSACSALTVTVTVKRCGTMATVIQTCDLCGPNKSFQWKSQPFILGRHPAGNVMLSFSILMAGVNITKVLLMFRHMKLSCISARTYFSHQNRFLFPAILQHWEWYRCGLISRLKGVKEALTWCGDSQFNSMGHSAKYGVYTILRKHIQNCSL